MKPQRSRMRWRCTALRVPELEIFKFRGSNRNLAPLDEPQQQSVLHYVRQLSSRAFQYNILCLWQNFWAWKCQAYFKMVLFFAEGFCGSGGIFTQWGRLEGFPWEFYSFNFEAAKHRYQPSTATNGKKGSTIRQILPKCVDLTGNTFPQTFTVMCWFKSGCKWLRRVFSTEKILLLKSSELNRIHFQFGVSDVCKYFEFLVWWPP